MSVFNPSQYDLELGDHSAYDCKYVSGKMPPMPKDWAHRAARGILENFRNRRDIGPVLESFDQEIRVEIIESISDIIREAARPHNVELSGCA